jgi:cytochrome c553
VNDVAAAERPPRSIATAPCYGGKPVLPEPGAGSAQMNPTRRAVAAALAVALCGSAHAASPEPPPGAASCTGCHPANADVQSAVPRLAGRAAAEMVDQMQAFRSGRRDATVMDQIVKGFTDAELQAIAAWYAAQR